MRVSRRPQRSYPKRRNMPSYTNCKTLTRRRWRSRDLTAKFQTETLYPALGSVFSQDKILIYEWVKCSSPYIFTQVS